MKYLLAAINAKYIHSNLGIYSLKRYAEAKLCKTAETGCECGGTGTQDVSGDAGTGQSLPMHGIPQIELGEYTINHQMERILQDIYKRSPDVAGFSCYIWNILYVKELVRNLKKVMPQIRIWLGGPEVSYDAEAVLRELPEVDLVMLGEGEETFRRLVELAEEETVPVKAEQAGADTCGAKMHWRKLFYEVPGIVYRAADGGIASNGFAPLMNLDEIPFSYENLDGLEHRIIYYESSRGCPFSCSYCLSSIDKSVRFRSPELVKKELDFFLERKVPQVKFVDRTFNCKKSHSMEIWRYLLEHDNGVTNFHFEVSADLLDEEELELIGRMRPGLIQLEIGVQTTHPETITEIRRKMNLEKLARNVAAVNEKQNIHQHLDLIAGLPYENLERFRRSFDDVYRMRPEQLQLGFLKVLKGSYMEEMAETYGLKYQSQPPYEVLSTRWLSYGDIILLKGVEEMVEVYYNSGQFRKTIKELEKGFETPFAMYEGLAQYYETKQLSGISHNRLARYEILYDFIRETLGDTAARDGEAKSARVSGAAATETGKFRDLLMYDLYLRENVKSRPSFAGDLSVCRETIKRFFMKEAEKPLYLRGYEGYDSRQLAKMAHMEPMGDGSYVLFDYKNRDALLGNARAFYLTAEQAERRE